MQTQILIDLFYRVQKELIRELPPSEWLKRPGSYAARGVDEPTERIRNRNFSMHLIVTLDWIGLTETPSLCLYLSSEVQIGVLQ